MSRLVSRVRLAFRRGTPTSFSRVRSQSYTMIVIPAPSIYLFADVRDLGESPCARDGGCIPAKDDVVEESDDLVAQRVRGRHCSGGFEM